MPTARNPKTASFTVRVDERVNADVERLSDLSGMNKATFASLCIAIGANVMNSVFLQGLQGASDTAVSDATGRLGEAITSTPGIKGKK